MRALLMRLALVFPLLLALACNRDLQARPPTNTRLYYPTGLAFVPPEDLDAGVGRIYVASSNFDRRFDVGWVTVLDLAQVRTPDGVRSLPPPGVPIAAPPDGGSDQGRPVQFTRFTPDAGPAAIVNIASFAGLATVDLARKRLFIPSRAENDFLAVMDVSTPADGSAPLRCFFSGGTDCTVDSIDMAVEQTPGSFGIPAAPQPYSVTLATDTDEFYVTHLRPASSPAQSLTNLQNFLVRMTQSEIDAARAAFPSAGAYVPPASDFTPIGAGASNSIVVNPGTVPG